jgi:pimeloyl-ACP methyl ester carboxylesterase
MPTAIELKSSAPRRAGTRDCLVYMISGNPGCITYYEDFLTSLKSFLAPIEGDVAFHVSGKDLAGFNDGHAPFSATNPPFTLEDQIRLTIEDLASRRIEALESQRHGYPYDFVLLIGHSVGAYIALEIFHRLMKDPASAQHLNLSNGILLFPTVTHIAHSPSGRRLDYIRRQKWLSELTLALALNFLKLCSRNSLYWVCRKFLDFSPKTAYVTADFLKNHDAVWQGLHMGKDEMAVISEEKWEKELWEIQEDAVGHGLDVPKFFFFFGKSDHWVSDKFRSEFIDARKSHEKGQTRIVIDEGNLRHAFCTSEEESVLVARKVANWIEEIVRTFSSLHNSKI